MWTLAGCLSHVQLFPCSGVSQRNLRDSQSIVKAEKKTCLLVLELFLDRFRQDRIHATKIQMKI